jgi:hypothetical protein
MLGAGPPELVREGLAAAGRRYGAPHPCRGRAPTLAHRAPVDCGAADAGTEVEPLAHTASRSSAVPPPSPLLRRPSELGSSRSQLSWRSASLHEGRPSTPLIVQRTNLVAPISGAKAPISSPCGLS